MIRRLAVENPLKFILRISSFYVYLNLTFIYLKGTYLIKTTADQ